MTEQLKTLMKKRLHTLLVSLVGSALYIQQALADLADQCLLDVPVYTNPRFNSELKAMPVHIEANKAAANDPEHVLFSGKVNIEYGNSTLSADEVQLTLYHDQNHDLLRTVIATGNVNYDSNEIKLKGIKAWSNLKTKDTNIYQGTYQMVGRQGRGHADTMQQRGDNRYTLLENGSFTSCLPGDDSWTVVGSEVIHDRKEQVAKVWNARFKIGNVPIFYSPYLQISVGDKRRSGFLMPNSHYRNNNGFEIRVPYYLNQTPNYDATITPHYMSKRGTQIQTEFRYLFKPGEGLVEFDWLPKDRLYSRQNASDRWLLYGHHRGVMNQVWRFNIDYTKVSDSHYFDDLDCKYGSSTDGYATQQFSIGYADANWYTALAYKQFQIFEKNNRNAYRAAPQLDLTYYKNDIDPFHLIVFSQAAKFINVNNAYPQATRLHIEPTLNLPISNRWGRLNIEAKLMSTYYQQINIKYYNEHTNTGRRLKKSINRIFPQFKTDARMVFERDVNYATGYTQTLEPRLQYLYVPYHNQTHIGVYDSTILQTDYSGLFRDRTYSGLDRISSANQFAAGVITQIYDAQLMERFNASVGQMYYFSQAHTEDITGTYENYDNTGSVLWAGDIYWRMSNEWGGRGCLQYDFRLNSVALGNALLEYRQDKNRLLQVNYRYASPQYIQMMLSEIGYPGYQQGISQIGITSSWPLANRWSLVGAYYYDTKADQPADRLIGMQYNTCCWALSVGYERKITGWHNTDNSSQYANNVSFKIELRGLSSNDGLERGKMVGGGIVPYKGAF